MCCVFAVSVVVMFIFFFPFLDIMFVSQQELISSIITAMFTRNNAARVGGINGIAGKEKRVLFLNFAFYIILVISVSVLINVITRRLLHLLRTNVVLVILQHLVPLTIITKSIAKVHTI